jgi:hypothetical protein
MAANLAALRAALTRVGFTAPVAVNITDVENIDSLEEFKLLSSDDVEILCQTPFPTEHRTELDSHAGTCCLSKHVYIVHETSKYVDVTPFHPSLPPVQGCPIISGALAYDDPETGSTHIWSSTKLSTFLTWKTTSYPEKYLSHISGGLPLKY